MKKFFLLTMASLMTVFAMAIGRNDGSTKANAIDFDWDLGNLHTAGTKWYRVDLAPLYEEENPSLTLYVTNPSRDNSVEASMTATVAGETETKHYTVSPHEHQIYSANASVLVRLHQTEIYLTLTTDGDVLLSAKVFESSDLDETCKDAKELKWDTEATQTKGYAAWWKVDLSQIKDTVKFAKKDAKVTLTNAGKGTVNVRAGQSLDCPSSGLTKRNFTLAAGESIEDTIPQSMILNVYPDELYFSIENLEQPVKIKVEMVDQPAVPVIPGPSEMAAVEIKANSADTTIQGATIPAGQTLYAFSVADMNSLAKYEPEFTYRNENGVAAHVTTKMAFERPAFGTSNTSYTIAAGEDEIVVYKKNMLEGLTGVDSIFLLTISDQPITFLARFKHVREGKACKTNIDFNWETGHTQEARTTQWYAVDISEPRSKVEDIVVHLVNLGAASAKIKASLAFSCPYIDLQEVSQTVEANKEIVRTLRYSSYAMMSDTVWIGLETSQDLKFWVGTKPAQTKEPDKACEQAVPFNWESGVAQAKDDTVWYRINMNEVREQAAKFPTVVVQNMSADNAVKIKAELSLECPDSIENQKRELTIAAKGTFTKQISRNLFENIIQDEIFLRVIASEDISLQIRLTEEAEGSSCSSAIPFNWVSGATHPANADLWYVVDLRDVMQRGNDIVVNVENRDNAKSQGSVGVLYSCPGEDPSTVDFTMDPKELRKVDIQNSMLDALTDSLVYLNVESNTSLRVWIDTLAVKPFTPITGEGINLIPVMWDSTYVVDVDTIWCVIPKSELDKVREAEERVKPVAHLWNLGPTENKIKAEAAFAFPITKGMMESVITLKSGAHTADTIPVGTFEQFLKKDSIILRVTRPGHSGKFQFKAELIKAFSGNTRKEALPVSMDQLYTQGANTEMWYKIKTADLKKPDLYNKVLYVAAKNAGKGDTEIRVEAYDGLKSEDDMLMNRGKKVIKKGESRSHNIPAQAIYGVGNVELYIKVRTTDSIVFSTKFNGEYAPLATIDPEQQNAKLIVPNVEYTIEGDNQAHWYQVCLPYIQNNYKYTETMSLTYELDGQATIEGTATFQDTMKCAMPVRSRVINKSGKHYSGTKYVSKLIEEAVKKAGYTISLDETQPAYIDSLLHRFVTKDSVTLYVRFKTDNTIKFKLNALQTTGDDCLNAMSFDWEHGNVNPKNLLGSGNSWYVVALDTTKLYAEGKSLRLHVDNWSKENADKVKASLYFKCGDPSQGDISTTIAKDSFLTKDISLDFIKASSPQLMFIEFNSSEDTHIWLEKIDYKRDTVYADTTFFVCKGGDVLGKTINADTVWNDTIRNIKSEDKLAIYDSISTVYAFVLREPKAYDFSAQLGEIHRNAVLDLTTADTWLKAQYAADDNDTIQTLSSIKWQYAVYPSETFKDIDLTNQPTVTSERIKVRYFAFTECTEGQDPDPSKGIVVYKNYLNTARDTAKITRCNMYKWPENDSLYIESTTANPDSVVFPGGVNWGDSILYLSLTLNNPAKMDLKAVAKYGNRLLLINRWDFAKYSFATDSIYTSGGAVKVEWFEMLGATPDPENTDKFLVEGYSYNKADGSPLVGTFYAVVKVDNGTACGLYGRTNVLVCGAPAGVAPLLAPSIVMPGEDIKVLNLNPDQETTIRIFTTEGLLHNTYKVSGQETFTIKAANDHGFYLVELLNGEEKSTLRYIVK